MNLKEKYPVSITTDVRKWNRLAIWSLLFINHFTDIK